MRRRRVPSRRARRGGLLGELAGDVEREIALRGPAVAERDRPVLLRKSEAVNVVVGVSGGTRDITERDRRCANPLGGQDALTGFLELAVPIDLAVGACAFTQALRVLLPSPWAREVERTEGQHPVGIARAPRMPQETDNSPTSS